VAGHFNFFGNPYQSAVDMNAVLAQSSNINTNNYYVYDPSLGDRGQYVTVQLPAGTNTAFSNANQYLQPGQAAMVTTAANGAASVVFGEAAKAPGQHTQVFGPQPAPTISEHFLIGRLFTTERFEAGLPLHDSFGVWFDADFSNDITAVDAVKAYNLDENMGLMHPDGVRLSIEQRAMPEAGEVRSLVNDQYRHTDYTLVVEMGGLDSYDVFMDDLYTGASQGLKVGSNEISFSVVSDDPASTASNRFQFRFEETLLHGEDQAAFDFSIYPNPVTNGTVTLRSSGWVGETVHVSLRNVLGQQIFKTSFTALKPDRVVALDASLASGVYFLECELSNRAVVRRLVIE
jgi:hypothetical protein